MNRKIYHVLKWVLVFVILIVGVMGTNLLVGRGCYRLIPGTDATVHFPCTWYSVPITDSDPSNTLQLEPRIRRHGNFGVQVEFVRDCTAEMNDCDPTETLQTIKNSIIAQDKLDEDILTQFGPIQQLTSQNAEIYYMERERPSVATLLLTGRIYAIQSNDRLFLAYSLRYSNAYNSERFDLTVDQIALSIR